MVLVLAQGEGIVTHPARRCPVLLDANFCRQADCRATKCSRSDVGIAEAWSGTTTQQASQSAERKIL